MTSPEDMGHALVAPMGFTRKRKKIIVYPDRDRVEVVSDHRVAHNIISGDRITNQVIVEHAVHVLVTRNVLAG
jgi:hypothetical protein